VTPGLGRFFFLERKMNTVTYQIYSGNLLAFRRLVATLTRKAEKLDLRFSVKEGPKGWVKSGSGAEYVEVTPFDVEFEPLKLENWTFEAKVDHTPEGNIIRKAPGIAELPSKFRHCSGDNCDHCHTLRRRKSSYIVFNPEEGYRQIGAGCVKDFLPGTDPEKVLSVFDLLDDLETFNQKPAGLSRNQEYLGWDILQVLAVAVLSISRYGFRKSTQENSTVSDVRCCIASGDRYTGQSITRETHPTEYAQAEKILAWAMELKSRMTLNEYQHNISTVVQNGVVPCRQMGLAVSIPVAYNFEQEAAVVSVSEWQGTLGENLLNQVTLKKILGTTFGCIYLFESPEGNVFSSYDIPENKKIGDVFLLYGKVSQHREYRGVKSTLLKRVAILESPEDLEDQLVKASKQELQNAVLSLGGCAKGTKAVLAKILVQLKYGKYFPVAV